MSSISHRAETGHYSAPSITEESFFGITGRSLSRALESTGYLRVIVALAWTTYAGYNVVDFYSFNRSIGQRAQVIADFRASNEGLLAKTERGELQPFERDFYPRMIRENNDRIKVLEAELEPRPDYRFPIQRDFQQIRDLLSR